MKYELKNYELVGPASKKDENTFNQAVNVTSGIVGQTYKGFTNQNTVVFEFPAKGLDADEISALIEKQATDYVAETYPDTPTIPE